MLKHSTVDDARVFVRKTQKTAIIFGVAIGAMLTYFLSNSAGYGFIAGTGVSIVNFQLMAVDAFQITGKAPRKARKYIIGRYFIRYALIFCFLILIVTRTDLNIIAAFVGLFFVQMVLVCGQLLHGAHSVLKTTRG